MHIITNNDKPPVAKLTESEADAFQHDSYLMQIREQSCNHCKSGEQWSELYEVWVHPHATHRTAAHVLRPTLTLRPGFAIAHLRLPTVIVPVCSDCIERFNPAEGSILPAASHAAWRETLQRKYAPAPTAAKASRPEPTLDQL